MADLLRHTRALRQGRADLAIVPTMGALHAGHLALVTAARRSAGAVAASIFVNPLQFGPNEDFARYPRDEAGDLALLRAAGCDLAWVPSVDEMYPHGSATRIEVAGPALGFEGAHRPGHFTGVATVVARLFGQVRPDLAFFGEKDWQQLQVVRRMTADLLLPVRVIGVPTVREPDGLAMSSRNRFLTPAERAIAPRLHAVLAESAAALARGEAAAAVLAAGTAELRRAGFEVDYLALVDGETMQPVTKATTASRLLAAARLGTVRLLDNIPAQG